MSALGTYRDQDITWLRQHQIELRNAVSACTLAKTYVISGRQMTREDLPVLQDSLAAVTVEIRRQEDVTNGTVGLSTPARVVYADFSNSGISNL